MCDGGPDSTHRQNNNTAAQRANTVNRGPSEHTPAQKKTAAQRAHTETRKQTSCEQQYVFAHNNFGLFTGEHTDVFTRRRVLPLQIWATGLMSFRLLLEYSKSSVL